MIVDGYNVQDVTFHDAVTSTSQGTPFIVGRFRTLTIEVTSAGGNSARTVAFKATGPSGTAISITGTNIGALTTGASTTGTGELWQFDVTGLSTVIMDLTAITGGNVTVKGKAVA